MGIPSFIKGLFGEPTSGYGRASAPIARFAGVWNAPTDTSCRSPMTVYWWSGPMAV